MHILLTGANGFIGSHLTTALLAAGHGVTGCVRDPASFVRRFPAAHGIAADLNRDVTTGVWLSRLVGIDAVINCAGILQDEHGQSSAAIHLDAPSALFDACVQTGVRRVIQISAISATRAADTDYALTKLQADEYLRSLALDWIVLRPSLVYAEGSYGGTSLLRAFAAMPFAMPVVGSGDQLFQPLHVGDLAQAVLASLHLPPCQTLDPVGPETLSFSEILIRLRGWLGFRPAPLLHMPRSLVATACRIGDVLGTGALRTTSLKQIEHGNTGDPAAFIAAIGFTPRRLDEALAAHPATAQDRWHARLYLARPLLTASLAILWLVSGLLGLCQPAARDLALQVGIPASLVLTITILTSVIDLSMAAALLFSRKRVPIGKLQLAIVTAYTLFLTATMPGLWVDPLGPLLKNLPIMAAMLIWLCIAEDR